MIRMICYCVTGRTSARRRVADGVQGAQPLASEDRRDPHHGGPADPGSCLTAPSGRNTLIVLLFVPSIRRSGV